MLLASREGQHVGGAIDITPRKMLQKNLPTWPTYGQQAPEKTTKNKTNDASLLQINITVRTWSFGALIEIRYGHV